MVSDLNLQMPSANLHPDSKLVQAAHQQEEQETLAEHEEELQKKK